MISANDNGRPDETRSFRVLSPGSVISHYTIIEKLGEGGMGVVYKAEDTKLGRTVALKFLPPHLLCDAQARERFEHEARAASALNHPNIATIHDIDEAEGRCFIAMEYLEGGSLRDLFSKGDLSLKQTLDLAIQIGEGLAAAHEQGVVHRDMKPDNIMLTAKGRAKIMDFGLAKLKGATRVTEAGTTLGTLRYMSPEQAGGGDVDQRSDIFSLGVILYEMLTGRLPFQGETEAAVIHSIINDAPEPIARYKASAPEGLQRVIDRALIKEPQERYQHADDMVAALLHEKRLLETGASKVTQSRFTEPAVIRPSSKRRLLHIALPAAIVAAVAIVLLVFEPFRIEMGPRQEASAQENSLAIMYFENMVDPGDTDRLAQMITTLLITDLSESEYMYVISRQRLYDILKVLGKEDLKVIDRTVATEVARTAGVKWILTGSILKVEPGIVLTSDISDASTGRILATQRITGQPGEDLFAVTDRLSAAIRGDLSLPEAGGVEIDTPVADVTTHSPEAYRHYVEGVEYDLRYLQLEAAESYSKAIEYDTTFAMAYLELAWLHWGTEQGRGFLEKAVKYADRASERQRYYILSWEASYSGEPERAVEILKEGIRKYPDDKRLLTDLATIYNSDMRRHDKAVEVLLKAIELDPLYKEAYNQLAYQYHSCGDYDRSVWAINKYLALAPDEPNPYDSRADLYAYRGRIDDAAAFYKKAIEVNPNFVMSVCKLGHMHLFRREYEQAERCYKKLATSNYVDARAQGRLCLAVIPAHRGRFEESLRVLTDALAADRMDQYEGNISAEKHRLKAEIHMIRGESDLALAEAERACDAVRNAHPSALAFYSAFNVLVLAGCGGLEQAEEAAEAFRARLGGGDRLGLSWYWISRGFISAAQGDADGVISNMERAVDIESELSLTAGVTLARAYLESGNPAGAITELERALLRYDDGRATNPTAAILAQYLLGQAYQEAGWNEKAVEKYELFLETWQDADPGIPEIEDARLRLARLSSGP